MKFCLPYNDIDFKLIKKEAEVILVTSGQTEFPCTFPCDWINKTFALYRNRSNSIESVTSMTFNDDGTTGTIFSTVKMQCFQISEQFLVIRNTRSTDVSEDVFWFFCIPVFYTPGQSHFTMHIKDGERPVFNQTVALSETQLCQICGTGTFTSFGTVLALAPAPNVIHPAPCEAPSNCQSDSGIVCPQGGNIPKECFDDTTTTDKTTTSSQAQPTTVTTDTPTTSSQTQPTTTTSDTPTTSSQTQPTTTTSDIPATSSQTQPTTTTPDTPTTSSQTQPTTTTSDTPTTSSQTQPTTTTSEFPTTSSQTQPTTTTSDTPTTSSQTQPTTTTSDTPTTSSQTQPAMTTSESPTTSSQPTTTTSDTTTTSLQTQPITTTSDTPTTTRAKKPCGRRGRVRRHGH
ncbi:Hypothetical predicted protein [Mytilus galloprovincialis]|uniref:Uncharacterized protein n=1 Tax=Mytilus galloprovincialis TaxID=29158 RepID=A0A8B6CRZ8_MYTGA|nr:Hypothetical predicted protein [Mytilus galloprovincialis]